MTTYTTLTDYKAWADARGYSYGDDTEIEAAIQLATDFIDTAYTFRGEALEDTQEVQLPTDEVALADVEKAANQATYLQLLGRLWVDPVVIGSSGQVTSESKSVGSLSTSKSYAEGYQYTTTYPTSSVDRLLRGLIVAGGVGRSYRG